jgi:hypothetical protein
VQYACTSGIGIEPVSSKLWHPAQWNWKSQEPTSLKEMLADGLCNIVIDQ